MKWGVWWVKVGSRIRLLIRELGRLVIPASIRETLGLQPNADVILELEGNRVVLENGAKRCRICGSGKELMSFEDGYLCFTCIRKIQQI